MCDQATHKVIEDVVTEKVNGNELFTAFDVSLAVQERSIRDGLPQDAASKENRRHRYIKNDIHRLVNQHVTSGVYQQQLWDVGAPSQAFLYFPTGSDPNNYVPRPRRDASASPSSPAPSTAPSVVATSSPGAIDTSRFSRPLPVATPAAATAAGSTDDDEGDGLDSGRLADARGTVCVPTGLIKSAGFLIGETAYVVQRPDLNALTLTKAVPAGYTPATSYTVDCNGNVRVTKPTLNFLDENGVSPASYDFEVAGNQVLVKAHQATAVATAN